MSFFANRPDPLSQAFYDTGRWRSYAELYAAADRWASVFSARPKPLILSFCHNDFDSIAAYLGALEAAAAIALLPENIEAEFRAGLIHAYQPDFIFDSTAAADSGAAYEIDPSRPGLWRRRVPSATAPIHDQLALLLATSGTTGNPRLVRLSLENLRANGRAIAETLAITPRSRAIASLPLHYSYGLSVINSHLLAGASVTLTNEGLMSPAFWELVREQECDSFAGVPYSYQILDRLNLDNLAVPSLLTLTQAGGKLAPASIEKFHYIMTARGGRFFTMYGQTEATARISILPPALLPHKLGSVGLPLAGGSLEIEGPLEEDGEIVYSGPNVMLGYAESRADLALGDTQGGRLHTGDLGRIDDDGCLWITGRLRREAKVFGLRLNLDDLENMVRIHGPAAAIATIAAPDRVRIFCEFDESLFAPCRSDLSARLRVHSQAFELIHMDRLPTTPAGKIDYRALENRP